MGFFTIAVINSDLVIGIIAVIGWLIAQGLSKKSKAPPPRPPPVSSGPGEATRPADDLHTFFENLERGLTGQLEQPAPPARAEVRPPPLHHHPERHHVRIESLEQPRAAERPAPALTPFPAITPRSALLAPQGAERWKSTPNKWAAAFSNPSNLKQMIVATEVLGAPLALRKTKSTVF